jgi:hypothetical protein
LFTLELLKRKGKLPDGNPSPETPLLDGDESVILDAVDDGLDVRGNHSATPLTPSREVDDPGAISDDQEDFMSIDGDDERSDITVETPPRPPP